MSPRVHGYIICAMPRSGSYHLCDLLDSTGVLGHPSEYLNPDTLQFLGLPPLLNDPRARAQQALRLGTTPNGIYGIKVLAYHVDHYAYRGWLDDFPNRSYIYLTRDDLLGQALSLARAQQTQQWTSTMPSVRGEHAAYDAARIKRCLNDLVLDEARWRTFFARNGIAPLHSTYEELLGDPQGLVSRIAAALDLETAVRIATDQLTFTVQRDEVTEQWRQRFLADSADLNYLDSNGLALRLDESDGRTNARSASDKLIVWGAGLEAKHTIAQRFDVSTIDFFIDSDPAKHGSTFLGLPVRPPEALLAEHDRVVLIGSPTHEVEIRGFLDADFAGHVRRVLTLAELLHDQRAIAAR